MENEPDNSPHLLPIEKNSEAKKNTVLTNIIKMLTERKILDHNNLTKNITFATSIKSDDLIYKIPIDMENVHKHYIVKFIHQKITSISKSSGIADFLNQYKNSPKIVVVSTISTKLLYGIKNDTNYLNTEIFLEKELMINLIDHIAVPKHILLSEEEKLKVLESYNAKRREIPEVYVTDPVSRYYNVKIGQLFRIIRPSETAGYVPTYRLVIPGNVLEGS